MAMDTHAKAMITVLALKRSIGNVCRRTDVFLSCLKYLKRNDKDKNKIKGYLRRIIMISKLPQQRGHIALIFIDRGSMAEGVQEAVAQAQTSGHQAQDKNIQKLGGALAQLGWQVDIFTRRTHPEQVTVVEHHPGCRTIRLQAEPLELIEPDQMFGCLSDFLKAFLEYQSRTGILYPLIHTHCWLSSWIGMELQERQTLRMVHTLHSIEIDDYASADAIPAIAKIRQDLEKQCIAKADGLVVGSTQDQEQARSLLPDASTVEVALLSNQERDIFLDWDEVIAGLDALYLDQIRDLHYEFFNIDEGNAPPEAPHLTVVESISQMDALELGGSQETAIAV